MFLHSRLQFAALLWKYAQFDISGKQTYRMLMFTLQGDESVPYKTLGSRVTLLLPEVSIAEVPAGAHRDLQAEGVRVVVEGKLQLSHHANALKDTTVCAAAAALRGQTQRRPTVPEMPNDDFF